MELKRDHCRAMIFYDFKWSLKESQSLERSTQVFSDLFPSRAKIFGWFIEFERGKTSLEDEERSGRPSTVVTEENISRVEVMIKDDPRLTYKNIEMILGISSPSVSTILPHNLSESQKHIRMEWCGEMLERFNSGESRRISDIVTRDETCVYQFDPETNRQSSVWFFPDEQPPIKVKRPRSVGKKMAATFFSISGHVATVMLENQRSVNAKWYTETCLPRLFAKHQERRPWIGLWGILLQHDNASAHTTNATISFLEKTYRKLFTYPTYSPNLVPRDFFLFPNVKNRLR
ncbi:hypothetical protein ANN_30196 [Periplaneta americana]|uniref:Mos1 transposase HTH domain-containing protein n=1 Tax=Periplaneta americana TaxID=6978 RepID=A0ABQ8SMA0_PERAM|nr:hypothetical protein ANN_30196 [Periplaneta americana]